MIQMLYEYNTEYSTKYFVTCYDADINSTRKTGLSFNLLKAYQASWPNGDSSGFTI